jgi:hypothetical protein
MSGSACGLSARACDPASFLPWRFRRGGSAAEPPTSGDERSWRSAKPGPLSGSKTASTSRHDAARARSSSLSLLSPAAGGGSATPRKGSRPPLPDCTAPSGHAVVCLRRAMRSLSCRRHSTPKAQRRAGARDSHPSLADRRPQPLCADARQDEASPARRSAARRSEDEGTIGTGNRPADVRGLEPCRHRPRARLRAPLSRPPCRRRSKDRAPAVRVGLRDPACRLHHNMSPAPIPDDPLPRNPPWMRSGAIC